MPIRYTAKELMDILKKDGWFLVRTKGSHYIFQHHIKKGIVPVPMHKGIVPMGTANSILKAAGLK
jgi:predicted RNA binding protein YcfA (HicA-like mRNA interferase family)